MFKTEQEEFWAGDFGDAYAARNASSHLLAANLAFFSRVLERTGPVTSVSELGANVGMNLRALGLLLPGVRRAAVEINANACTALRAEGVDVIQGSFLEQRAPRAELGFVKGVLIHIAPEQLSVAYDSLDAASERWCLVAEYYNPTPVTVPYRGHSDRLFKRDFAGEFLSKHSRWSLVDYGFLYRRDPVFPQDDITWFLMRSK